jgi:hypothetical protein
LLEGGEGEVVWKVYKRRWFGLLQLVLLNVVVSWDVSSPSAFGGAHGDTKTDWV